MPTDCKYCLLRDTGVVPAGMRVLGHLGEITVLLLEDADHPGRCVLAPPWHTRELFQLEAGQRAALIEAASALASLLARVCHTDKVNLGFYGDRADHLHAHLVPKWEGGAAWGDAFAMAPRPGPLQGPGPFAGWAWDGVAVHLQVHLNAAG